MPKRDIDYTSFQWHFGVVEDRNDPLKIGRVKVRFYGVHTDDLSKLKTEQLPWATVVQSPMSTSNSGKGGPITGIIEGTWVIGFFIDEGFYQKPMVLGCIPGIPQEEAEKEKAFKDPNGIYPIKKEEPDSSRLARDIKAEDTFSLKRRRAQLFKNRKTAKAPKLELQEDKPNVDYENASWSEPDPRGFAKPTPDQIFGNDPDYLYPSQYPFNHVFESENNTIVEVDDTPGAQRINMEHGASGNYQEITEDGTRVTKVYGKDYEIIAKGKNVSITGDCNITIEGNMRLLVTGDKYEEITGNHFITVGKDKIQKIGGNDIKEVISDSGTQINGNTSVTISGDHISTIKGSETITVGKTHTETISGDAQFTLIGDRLVDLAGADFLRGKKTGDIAYVDNLNIGSANNFALKATANVKIIAIENMKANAGNNQSFTVGGDQTMAIVGNQGVTAAVTNINNDMNITGTSTATTDHVSAGKSGASHTHTDTTGLGAGTTSGPN